MIKRLFFIVTTLFSYAQAFDVPEDFKTHTWSFQTKGGPIKSDGEYIILEEEAPLPVVFWHAGSFFGNFEFDAPLILTPHLTKDYVYQKLCEAGLISVDTDDDENADDNEGN